MQSSVTIKCMKGQSKRRSRSRRRTNTTTETKLPDPTPYNRITSNFVACHRCDHFLSGYRAHVSEKTLNEQIDAQHNNWLTLSLDENVKGRVEGAYGVDVSADVVHLEGRCSVCGRLFVLEMDGENLLYIQADPRLIELTD